MAIPRIFHIPVPMLARGDTIGSISYLAIGGLIKARLIRHNTFGVCSPFTTAEKIASLTIKIFIAFPVLSLFACIDLICWSAKTIIAIPFCISEEIRTIARERLIHHCRHLVAIVALPILSLGTCLAGRSPAILSPLLTQNAMSYAYGIEDPLFIQCLRDGFKDGHKDYTPAMMFVEEGPYLFRIFPINIDPNHINPAHPIPALNYNLIQILLNERYILPNDKHGQYTAFGNYSSFRYKTKDGQLTRTHDHPILVEAARINDLKLIDMLVAKKADPNLIHGEENRKFSILTNTLLYKINPKTFAKLLEINDVNIDLDVQGSTAIAVAIMYLQLHCAKQLIDKGAKVWTTDLERLELFLRAFSMNESKLEISTEAYIRTLMEKITNPVKDITEKHKENYESNIYFKAILNRQIDFNLQQALYEKNERYLPYLEFFRESLHLFRTTLNPLENRAKEIRKAFSKKVYDDKAGKFFCKYRFPLEIAREIVKFM